MILARHPGREPRVSGPKALGLWLLIGVQLAIPSAYYLRRDDPEDERFSWRMFSSIRFRACEVQAAEASRSGERALVLQRELHASWVGSLRRGRRSVIEKFLVGRCADRGVTEAWLSRSCVEVDGTRLPTERFTIVCRTRALGRAVEARGSARAQKLEPSP